MAPTNRTERTRLLLIQLALWRDPTALTVRAWTLATAHRLRRVAFRCPFITAACILEYWWGGRT